MESIGNAYEHLRIIKEPTVNDRRRRKFNIPPITRGNAFVHGQHLSNTLTSALNIARTQPGSEDGTILLKLRYQGSLDFNKLSKHGVDFVSQEEGHVCVAFASEQGLAEFAGHLAKLGTSTENDLTCKQILLALEGIDNWRREDRESWAIKQFGLPTKETFLLDVELWPIEVGNSPRRAEMVSHFDHWLTQNNIRKIDQINRDSLVLYRLEATPSMADALFEHRDVRMIDLPPRTGISYAQMNVQVEDAGMLIGAPTLDAPRVCILDSGVNSNHPLIKNAFLDEESFIEGESPSDDVGHGTAVAGVALYGKLEECLASKTWKPEFWLCSGKLMKKSLHFEDQAEFDPKTVEHALENAVAYFAGEVGCRVFNISFGNENALYDGMHIRGIAYTLDRLAREHNVLFVVSAGNFRGTEEIPKDWREEYPEYLIDPASAIIDPAPALNAVVVGSLVNHTLSHLEAQHGDREINQLSPASENQPSPFTRHGLSSQKKAMKPDVVAHGGNFATPLRHENEKWRMTDKGLGVLTLSHNFMESTSMKAVSGTSFAAPYITHLAGRLLSLYPDASANLLRALLINHADIPDACHNAFPDELNARIRDVVGYGKVNEDTLFRSTDDEVVIMAEDSIGNDCHQFYELPLPDEFLRKNRAARQIRVTLAHSPAVRTTRIDYLATKMHFRLLDGYSLQEIQSSFDQKLKEEFDRIPEARSANREITASLREKSTVQSSVWKLKQLDPGKKWFIVVTRQDTDWGKTLSANEEGYALVVTVNDRENEEAQLYAQIKTRISEQVQMRVRISG